MVDDYEEQSTQVSGYNEAVLQIKRLHDHWLKADSFALSGNFPRWNWVLDTIYRELYPDIQKLKDKNSKIKQHNFFMNKIKNTNNRTVLYYYLDKNEITISL